MQSNFQYRQLSAGYFLGQLYVHLYSGCFPSIQNVGFHIKGFNICKYCECYIVCTKSKGLQAPFFLPWKEPNLCKRFQPFHIINVILYVPGVKSKSLMLPILKKGCTSLMFQPKLQYFHIVNLILYVLGIKSKSPSIVLHCIVDVNILLLEKNQICIKGLCF